MPTPDQIVQQMRDALAVSEPDLDTSIGSPTRKILDAVGVAIAPAYADSLISNYAFDIDSKTDAALDDFVAMLGFTRFAATRATGTVTFSRTTPADRSYVIPAQTQIATPNVTDLGSVIIATVVPAVLAVGQTSVDVPVQAVTGGEQGNVEAGSLTLFVTQLDGITSVTNDVALSGGTNVETDDALRDRVKRTALRSLAGTEQMYLGTALEPYSPFGSTDGSTQQIVTAANVIGSSKRWREQVQVDGSHNAASSIPAANVKYVYAGTQVVGADIDGGDILTPGVHYTFDTTVSPPVVRILNNSAATGAILDLDFEYLPTASRNDPTAGITNRVDVWVNGEDAVTASQVVYFSNGTTFSATAGAPMDIAKFSRADTANVYPTAGNIFLPLAFGPILTFPDQLVIGGTTYNKGTDYWVVHDDSAFGRGPTGMYGLEWLVSRALAAGTQISLTESYAWTYNYVPWRVEKAIRDWSLVTTDARAHAAKPILLLLNFVAILSPHADRTSVETALNTRMASFFAARGFDAVIQISDIIAEAHQVTGIDNIRFATSTDNATNYAIQWIDSNYDIIQTYANGAGRAIDLTLGDNEVPVLADFIITPLAQNTWNTGV